MTICPFCGRDPHEYADVGIGYVPVAITCCDPGVTYFTDRDKEEVVLSRGDFDEIGQKLIALRRRLEEAEDLNAELEEKRDAAVAEIHLLEEVCATYASDEDRYQAVRGEPYGSIPTEIGIKARVVQRRFLERRLAALQPGALS